MATKTKKSKQGRGRPSAYQSEFANIAFRHTLLGATDKDLAAAFSVSEQTVNAWKKEFPKFLESIRAGKAEADANVVNSLYGRATGYSHPDTDIRTVSVGGGMSSIVQTPIIKHHPPDVTAQIFWLKNRRPELFRDKPEVSVTVNNDVSLSSTQPEDWTQADLEAELKRRGAIPILHKPDRNGVSKHS